jgi:hypothetical protein
MSKEPPSRAHALADRLQALRVVAHAPECTGGAPRLLRFCAAVTPYAAAVTTTALDAVLADADADLRPLVVIEKEPATWLLIDAPSADDGALTSDAVEQMDGTVAKTSGTAALARFANPASAIGTWLTLSAWTGPDVVGAAVSGYGHRAELVGATLAEFPELLAAAAPGELWVSFELATSVDLNDERFAVERIDRGSLVPASCKLTLR